MAGTIASLVIWRKSGSSTAGWITVVIAFFSLWLLLHLILFYLRTVLSLELSGRGALLSSVSLITGTLAYASLFMAVLSVAESSRILITALFTPVIILNAYLLFSSSITSGTGLLIILGYSFSTLFLLYCAYLLSQRSNSEAEKFLKLYFHLLSRLIGVYAVLAPVAGGVLHLLRLNKYSGLIQFSFFFLICVLSLFMLPKLKLFSSAEVSNQYQADELRLKFNITEREAEVINLMADGLTNQEIADSLFISLPTVRTHLSNVFRKTGASSRTKLLKLITENK